MSLYNLNVNILDIWQVIVKRRFLIAGVFVIITFLTGLITISMSPVYRAVVQILIESENPLVVKVDAVTNEDVRGQDYYQTQYKILESRTIARDVIRKLALDSNPEFIGTGSWVDKVLDKIKNMLSGDAFRGDINDPLNPIIRDYLDKLSVKPVPRSRLVDICIDGYDRRLMAQIANEHARAYTNLTLSFRLTGSKEAAAWLTGQGETLRSTLRASEEKLQEFTKKHDMLALESMISSAQYSDGKGSQLVDGRGSSEANFIAQKLSELNSQQSVVRGERIAAETLFRQIRGLAINPEMIESVPEISSNLLIQKMKGDYVNLTRQLSDMREKFGDKHPKMVAIKEEIAGLNSKIRLEVAKIAKGVELQYEVALAKEKNLEKSLEDLKKNASTLNEKAIRYLELKGEVDLNRDLQNKILKRAKETALTSGLEATNVVIVDPAEVPEKPIRPRIVINMTVGIILGIFFGLSAAFILEYLDGTIDNPDQLEQQLKINCLGVLNNLVKENSESSKSILQLFEEKYSRFAESTRAIAVNVLFLLAEKDNHILLVTSATPEEGKTTACSSLAVVLAQMNRRVLLIDLDLRKPRAYKELGVIRQPGISDLVSSKCTLEEAIIPTDIENVYVIPPGEIQRNPLPLLSSKAFSNTIADICQLKFNIILLDAPPLLSVPDAQILSKHVDGTLVVIKAAVTHAKMINRAVKELSRANATVLGAILNCVDVTRDKYYYGKYSKYAGYYGTNDESGRNNG